MKLPNVRMVDLLKSIVHIMHMVAMPIRSISVLPVKQAVVSPSNTLHMLTFLRQVNMKNIISTAEARSIVHMLASITKCTPMAVM